MNVDDVKDVKYKRTLRAIFGRQRELMDKYHAIEEKNGIGYALVKDVPFHIDDLRWQYLIKDFAWRSMEEIAEAYDAYQKSMFENLRSPEIDAHIKEEIADALHFLVELFIIAGYDAEDFDECWVFFAKSLQDGIIPPTSVEDTIAYYLQELGMAMNHFKQKPWKQTHFQTDEKSFFDALRRSLSAWRLVAHCFGMSLDDIYDFYFRKSEVNKFRQRSGY